MTIDRWDSQTPGRIPKRKQEGVTEHPAEGVIVTVSLDGATFIVPAFDPALIWGPAPWCSRSAELIAPSGGLMVTTTAPPSAPGERAPTRPVAATGAPLVGTGTNAQIVYQTLVARGLTPAAATGVVGNLMAESSVNPHAQEPGGQGMGIAQWSRNGRWATLGLSLGDLQGQVDAMITEASDGTPGIGETWGNLAGINDANEAANIWMRQYELPADQSWSNAVHRANLGIQAVNGKQAPTTPLPVGAPPDAAGTPLNDAIPTATAAQPMPSPGDLCIIHWAGPDRRPWIGGWWSSVVAQPNAVDAAPIGGIGGTRPGGSAPISGGGGNTVPGAPQGANPFGNQLLALARTEIGKQYVWAAAGPNTFDCSGLVQYLARQMGLTIPHNSAAQYELLAGQGKSMSLQQAFNTPGALLFRGPGEHEAISVGDGVHTVEAHSAVTPPLGVVEYKIAGRTWTHAAHL